jgi:hypothetical protein
LAPSPRPIGVIREYVFMAGASIVVFSDLVDSTALLALGMTA